MKYKQLLQLVSSINVVIGNQDTKTQKKLFKIYEKVKTYHEGYQAEQVENDKTYFAEVYGTLSVPSPDPADFVPYDQVTYEMVCGWLEAGLDQVSLDENLDSQIAEQINPKVISLPLPFQNP